MRHSVIGPPSIRCRCVVGHDLPAESGSFSTQSPGGGGCLVAPVAVGGVDGRTTTDDATYARHHAATSARLSSVTRSAARSGCGGGWRAARSSDRLRMRLARRAVQQGWSSTSPRRRPVELPAVAAQFGAVGDGEQPPQPDHLATAHTAVTVTINAFPVLSRWVGSVAAPVGLRRQPACSSTDKSPTAAGPCSHGTGMPACRGPGAGDRQVDAETPVGVSGCRPAPRIRQPSPGRRSCGPRSTPHALRAGRWWGCSQWWSTISATHFTVQASGRSSDAHTFNFADELDAHGCLCGSCHAGVVRMTFSIDEVRVGRRCRFVASRR